MVGIGETENQIKEKVKRLGIEEVVIFHGLSDEVNRLWNMLDVFVMPSLYEGLPVAGVEAQANGLPLIVSNTITQELKITDTYTPSLFVKNFILPKEREEGIAVEN